LEQSVDVERVISDTGNRMNQRWCACTIAARNYLPSVQLLVETFTRHHPDIPFAALIVDVERGEDLRYLGFDVVTLADLSLDAAHLGRMLTYYDVSELCTALKPVLLRHLLEHGDTVVLYFDPDIECFTPVMDLFEAAERHEIVLTPHVTTPVPRDGLEIREEQFLLSGQFNLGFIGVSAAAEAFLAYWEERTQLFGLSDPGRGYFVDQRWVDAVPSLFPHLTVRDLGCNVAYWNLHERPLTRRPDGTLLAGGAPLRFFHFSGHDASRPYRLSRHLTGRPRVRVDREPVLRALLKGRSDRLQRVSGPSFPSSYGWERSAAGVLLGPVVRRLYWDAVVDAVSHGRPAPPHAFEGGGDPFSRWLAEPTSGDSAVSRHLLATWLHQRDLQAAFPQPLADDEARLIHWSQADADYLGAARGVASSVLTLGDVLPGVNLVGYLSGEFGVGEASRMIGRMVRAAGIPLAATTLYTSGHLHREQHGSTIEGSPFTMTVLAMNADGLAEFARRPEFAAHGDRVRIGVWYWEVGPLPERMRSAFSAIHEVWCASEHVAESIRPFAPLPVNVHPLAIAVPERRTALLRRDLGLPEDRFCFGFVFDHASVFRRKNPLGLIDAYQRAFGPDDGAALVLKAINADADPEHAALVADLVAARSDVVVLDTHFTHIEMRALYDLLDCYVSLHRSEGLGLTLAAAMAAGTPTVATGWSGNLTFMRPESSVLLPYDMVEVGPGADPYDPGASWAEPDVGAAAAAMRDLFEHPDAAAALGQRGRLHLQQHHDVGRAAEWLGRRFAELTGLPRALLGTEAA
jgi:glycosyltransferase involved in cell wall biosynthesis